ncbi:DUF1254 domain-containing protein [Bdellovibrio sp. HCB337]|uniref:DUF1254 domain-containing protein n=1 Tax=Bdellovibrio sp. HCB337 TaxID=3394358 RepID=UPI0039A5129D
MKLLMFILGGFLIFNAFSVDTFAASRKKKESIDELSRDAYIWGYPAVYLKHAKEAMLSKTKNPQDAINHFFHSHKVPDPFLGHFVSVHPENLYSWAWVDLSKEPLMMTHPQVGDRYYSVQFVDAFSNVFHVISNDSHGDKPGLFAITPPGWRGSLPEGVIQIRSSTQEILVLSQTFVRDNKEAARIAKLTSQRHLIPLSSWNKGIQVDGVQQQYPEKPLKINRNLAALGLSFYKELHEVIAKNPLPTKADAQELDRFKPLGLNDQTALQTFMGLQENTKSMERGIFEGEREIQSRLATGFGMKINGWAYEMKAPPFTEDFLLRASVSQKNLFSVPADETVQMSLDVDSEARQLFSSYRYVIHFEKEDFPPSQNMWSLRVHEMKSRNSEDVPRPVSFINDRISRLKYNLDGSVDILLSHEKPAESLRSNWLQLSQTSNFYVVLTMFNPNNTVLNRKYIAPSLTRIDENRPPKQRITHTMMARQEEPVSK